jgi:hypothetical protein
MDWDNSLIHLEKIIMRQSSAHPNNNAITEYDSFSPAATINELSKALEKGNAHDIESTLEALTKMATTSSGNQIFSAFIMRDTPKLYYASEFVPYAFAEPISPNNTDCFTKLFLLTKNKSGKNNIYLLTYVFETVLNKLDEADHHLKNIIVDTFSASKNKYADALQFYLSQLSPEKIKDILSSDRLITKIIDIKPMFSKESDLRNKLNEAQKYRAGDLYAARDKLRYELKIEINRLRNKNNFNDTDIELSNILVRLRIDLKKNAAFFTSNELEIALNAEIGQAERIQYHKKLDTETVALLSTIKMIKSWYLLEYRKTEKMVLDELLSVVSAPKLPAESDNKNPIAKKEATATTETGESYPVAEKTVAAASTTVVMPQKRTATIAAANRFFPTPPVLNTFEDIKKALEAVIIPTHNPAVAALQVPKGPIKRDIIDELFDPVGCKI